MANKLVTKRGNVILIVVGIIVALMVSLGYLVKTTTSRSFTTKKLASTSYARELANSLAILSVHCLKEQIRNNEGDLVNILSMPLDSMPSDSGEKDILSKITLLTESNDNKTVLDLIVSKSGLKSLSVDKLYWKIYKSDFKNILVNNQKLYTREKSGLIHLYMTFSYVLPGKKNTDKDRSTETYHFVSDLKVVANIIPLLSKFTLYIDDALDGDSSEIDRFNVVDTDPNGQLNKTNYKPWVLNNHGNGDGVNLELKSYRSVVESSRGLVFLGGGKPGKDNAIRLGIAFGEIDSRSPYGEGFQFYCKEDTGYWKTVSTWNSNQGILVANIGLCNEIKEENDTEDVEDVEDEDDDYNTYFEMTGGTDEDKLNSIFRLCGTDQNISPTIVLGYVDAKYASIKQFKYGDGEDDYDLLANTEKEDFKYASSYDYDSYEEAFAAHDEDDEEYDDDLTDFAFKYRTKFSKKLEYNTYLKKYSSRIESMKYNNGYAAALDHNVEFPFKAKLVEGNKLKKLCNEDEDEVFTEIPNTDKAKYKNIYENAHLGELAEFLDANKLLINCSENDEESKSPRIAYYLKLTDDEPKHKKINSFHSNSIEKDFIKYLEAKGIILKDKLDFNGWIYIDNYSNSDFILDLNGKNLVSHGGIILSNGNFRIKSDIKSESIDDKKSLTIITLGENADIIIEKNVQQIDGSLISKAGQVKLEGSGNDSELYINGNIVMKKIRSGNDGISAMRRGLNINYNINLSAIPYTNSEEEKNVLMINLKDNPKIYKND